MKLYISEYLGSLFLSLITCGIFATTNTILVPTTSITGGYSILPISIGAGLVYYVVKTIFDHKDNTFNPPFTIINYFNKEITLKECLLLIVSQLAGSLSGVLLLGIILGPFASLGANGYLENSILGSNFYQVLTIESIAYTFLILGYLKNKKDIKNISILITLLYLFTIPYTNGALNIAKTIASSLVIKGTFINQLPAYLLSFAIATTISCLLSKLKK